MKISQSFTKNFSDSREARTPIPLYLVLMVTLLSLIPPWLAYALGWAQWSSLSQWRPFPLIVQMALYFGCLTVLFYSIKENVLTKMDPAVGSIYSSALIAFPLAGYLYYRGEFHSFYAFQETILSFLPALVGALALLKYSSSVVTAVLSFWGMTVFWLFGTSEVLNPIVGQIVFVAKSPFYFYLVRAGSGLSLGGILLWCGQFNPRLPLRAIWGLALFSLFYDGLCIFWLQQWETEVPPLPLLSISLLAFASYQTYVSIQKFRALLLGLISVAITWDIWASISVSEQSYAQVHVLITAALFLFLNKAWSNR